MKKQENKSLIEVNEKSIFYKIKNFFRKLFRKEEITIEKSYRMEEDTNFFETLRDDENINLLELQFKLKNEIIKIEDLNEETKIKLIQLYEKQNHEKEKHLQALKNKILIAKSKLQTNM